MNKTFKEILEKEKKKLEEVKKWHPLSTDKVHKNKKVYSRKKKHNNSSRKAELHDYKDN